LSARRRDEDNRSVNDHPFNATEEEEDDVEEGGGRIFHS
jgi:hypothetical protein